MALGSVITYKKNDIRLPAVNFITGAFLYIYLAVDFISGKTIVSSSRDMFLTGVFIFACEIIFCAVSIILAFYQRQYNRHLAETNLGNNRWFLSERTFNYLTAAVMFLFGWYLASFPITETHSGLATGGLFFDNHRIADNSNLFWQMVYFHFALCILPLAFAAWLLLFPPKRIQSKTINYNENI